MNQCQIEEPIILRNADFSGLLFNRANFRKHAFIDCDFSRSRWVFSFISDSDCSGSRFNGLNSLLFPIHNSTCTNCNFSEAEANCWDPFDRSNFKNADFTNAKLGTSHSFFKGKKPLRKTKFNGTTMDGCKVIIKREQLPENNTTEEEIQPLLGQIFSPEQLTVMHIEYEGKPSNENRPSGCFIATAACGINSEEVMILRHFRDSVLVNNALGRLFIRVYYRVSPPIASMIAGSPKAKYIVRKAFIRPWARLANKPGILKRR